MEVKTSREALEMEELLYQLLWSQLQSLGLFREKHAILTNQREQAGISASYDRWLQESVAFLERQQYLHSQDNICTVPDPTLIESATLWQRWDQHKERWMQNADLKAQVELVEITLRALPTILTGKRPATEILFPNGSMHLVEGIYQHNVIADYYNEVLAQLLATYLQERLTHERHARIRILEIGAGTGATTSKVLRMVQPYQASIAEYCYSDISEAFLRYGQQTYRVAAYPFLTYRLLNVEQPLAGQGIELGSYDVVIAANVLHATSNIRRTVCNVKAVLKKHGLLLLNEITGTSLFAHLTFGLLSGWWVYEDPELRVPGCPALSVENWQEVLGSEGFGAIYLPTQDVTCVPCATSRLASQETGQQIIVAESDGVVRQLRHLYPKVEAAKVPVLPRTVPAQPVMIRSGKSGSIVDNTDEALRKKSIAYLKGQVGKVLNLPSTKIDANEPLTSYGLDSILVLQLTKTLHTSMVQISSTLFFEYATIDALVEHFLHTQREALEHLVGFSRPANPDHPPTARRLLTWEQTDGKRGTEEDIVGETGDRKGRDEGLAPSRPLRSPGPQPLRSPVTPSIERDIAIIGLTGRYPGAKDVQTFWDLLSAGKSGIREIPVSRWDWRHYFQVEKGTTCGASPQATMYTKWGGFLENIESFDASFFHISPREAEQMDPQERLFLEVSYICIEDAGYTPTLLGEQGPVGVFVGVMNDNYSTGAKYWSIANRVSFALGLQGPSMAIDTACSSSLTALHCAVESLMCGTSMSAIVGGVNLIINPMHYIQLSQLGMLSASDQCKSFGENADGFVDGEGVGAILLKPLQRAEADGDHIYGVIKATAVNHGGKTNGYTVPNPQAQAGVIEQALKRAEIDPSTISYVEAHGTGTELGDPIEIAGLTRAFMSLLQYPTTDRGNLRENLVPPPASPYVGGYNGRTPNMSNGASVRMPMAQGTGSVPGTIPTTSRWCAIGSVKSNIGHTEGAAGVAGITKVLLQMRYRQLVPSLHAKSCNPHIDFSATPFVVQQELSEWKRPQIPEVGERKEVPRRAGISSFGAGGANAHVILEEYVEQVNEGRNVHPSGPFLIVLSARTEERLKELVQQLLAWMQREEDHSLALSLHNVAYTLQVGREAMEERLALQVSSLAELSEKLRKYLQDPQEAGEWYRGQVKGYKEIATLLSTDEELQEVVSKWFQRGKYEKLLQWWVKGLKISWHLLYTVGAGQEQDTGSAQGTIPTAVPTLPRRISLPTYPFAQERYGFLTSEDRRKVSVPNIGEASSPLHVGIVPVDTPNCSGELASPTTHRTSENGQVLNKPHRVALQPLTDRAVLSDLGDKPARANQSQPSVIQPSLDQSFSQPGTNGAVAVGTSPTLEVGTGTKHSPYDPQPMATAGSAQGTIPTASDLEEALARGLAKALYMEESPIDVEKPFIELGLDSVIGVEWIKSLNTQYAINLRATCVYDYPTIRQMAGFLQKELVKRGGEMQQTTVQSVSIPSLDDMLQKVKEGILSIDEAESVLSHI